MTSEDIKYANLVIVAFYGNQLTYNNPTENTVKILATMVKEASKCNSAMSELLKGLSALTGSGSAVRIVRAAAKLAKSDKSAFKMCNAMVKNRYRSPLEISMI